MTRPNFHGGSTAQLPYIEGQGQFTAVAVKNRNHLSSFSSWMTNISMCSGPEAVNMDAQAVGVRSSSS